MNNGDDFDPEEFKARTGQVATRHGRIRLRTQEKRPKKTKVGDEWFPVSYTDMRNLAYVSRNPLIAVLAEIHHLRFKALDKTKPVALSNVALRELGFHHTDKERALKSLEEAGMIVVERRKGRSPLVSILQPVF